MGAQRTVVDSAGEQGGAAGREGAEVAAAAGGAAPAVSGERAGTSPGAAPQSTREAVPPLTLKQAVRAAFRRGGYSPRTEESYTHWIFQFVHFHGRRSPRGMGAAECVAFLNHLAVERRVSSSTMNQALCALVFLYRRVYEREMPELEGLQRGKRVESLPTVVTGEEAGRILARLDGPVRLIVQLLYGSGLRLNEALSLRVKDVDFGRGQITVRRGKGKKDRAALLPASLRDELTRQIELVRRRHAAERQVGRGAAPMPEAMAVKQPGAATSLEWQFLFPAGRSVHDRETRIHVLPHLHESVVQKAVTSAVRAAGIEKQVSAHTFRHSFATALLEHNVDIRTIQTLLGHGDVSTTMIYTHIVRGGPLGVKSPLDQLGAAPARGRRRRRGDQ